MLWCCIKTRGVNKLGSWASCLAANRPSTGFAERSRSKRPKKTSQIHSKFIAPCYRERGRSCEMEAWAKGEGPG